MRIDLNCALVIIDMQEGINHPKLGRRNNPDAEERIAELLGRWRATGRPVIHVRHVSRSPDSVFWPGQPGAELQERFLPMQHEPLLDKSVPDAFCATGLEELLRRAAIGQLVVAGVITNNSIESTVRTAGNLGFDVLVPEDGCFTFDKVDLRGVHHDAEEVHSMSLANLHGEYGSVVSTSVILGALTVASE